MIHCVELYYLPFQSLEDECCVGASESKTVGEDRVELLVVEPHAKDDGEFTTCDLRDALERANIVLVLTDHREFRDIRPEALHEKLLIDTRGLYL